MCKNITDNAISFIATTLQQLQDVNIARCYRISDSSIVELANGLKGSTLFLRYLSFDIKNHVLDLLSIDLSFCTKLTNLSVIAISELCPNLTKLDISECGHIGGIYYYSSYFNCINPYF